MFGGSRSKVVEEMERAAVINLKAPLDIFYYQGLTILNLISPGCCLMRLREVKT